MTCRFSYWICGLIVVLAFVVPACRQKAKQEPELLNPLLDPNLVLPNYVSKATEAGGGADAWASAKQIRAEGVVSFYKPDGSFHLTEHQYIFRPWPDYIQVSGLEPEGKFVWELSPAGFNILKGVEQGDTLPNGLDKSDFTRAILQIITVPARLVDKPVELTKSSQPVKIKGRWYHSIRRVNLGQRQDWSETVFYQHTDSSLVDMIWLADFDREKFFAVHGYDYSEAEGIGVFVPTKVEIFTTDFGGAVLRRMARIDFYNLNCTR